MQIAHQKTSRYRPEIDGLRAFAVVAVIINHFNKDILPGGYLGVDIFFVISGYVITSSLFGRPSKDFKDFISGFYERRIKRLVPALSVFLLIMSIMICLFNPSPGVQLAIGKRALFGFSNIALYNQLTDYFAQSSELNVFTHTWSLGVEEQFYILFPFLIWFSGFGRQTKNGARNLFLIVGILSISSLIRFIYLYPINQSAAYFLMPSRFWEMAAGCLIFIIFQKRVFIEQFFMKVPPLLVLALMIGVMYLPMSMAAESTFAVVILSSILIASLKEQTAAFNIFTCPRVMYIGLISYSLYLWHWGVLSISRWTIGIHWWSVPFQISLILGLAIASYRWIETPLRRGAWFGNRWKTLMIGGGLIVISSLGINSIRRISENFYLKSSLPTTEQTWWFDKDGNYIEKCHVKGVFTKELMKECLGRSKTLDKNKIGYLIGDSHARNYLIAAREALPEVDIKYMTMGNGCAFLPSSMISTRMDKNLSCDQYSRSVASLIASESRPGDIVFIGQALKGDSHDKRAVREYFDNIRIFADTLKFKSIPVVIFDGTFPPGPDPALCVKEVWRPFPNKFNCEKNIDEVRSAYSQFDNLALSLSKSVEGIYYAPLRLGLCVNDKCGQYTKQGTPIWHDFGHITEQSSGELADLLREYLPPTSVIILNKE